MKVSTLNSIRNSPFPYCTVVYLRREFERQIYADKRKSERTSEAGFFSFHSDLRLSAAQTPCPTFQRSDFQVNARAHEIPNPQFEIRNTSLLFPHAIERRPSFLIKANWDRWLVQPEFE